MHKHNTHPGHDSLFETKNQRRRAARAESSSGYRQGRENRRAFAWNGAFGTEVVRVYNDCALGTSATQRQSKGDEDQGED
jgi:hypothetical protein